MMWMRPGTRALATLCVASLSGCASTSLVNMWKDTAFSGPPLHNFFVMSAAKNESRRRIFEDAFCAELVKHGAAATPSYRIFPDGPPSEQACQEHVAAGNYDGLMVVRRTGRETRENYVPGYTTVEPVTRYNPWWGTWTTAWREVHTPGYVDTETAVRFEFLVYGPPPGQTAGPGTTLSALLWTGTTETIDPTSAVDLSNEIAKTVIPELVKAKIIP
jgi:hypothetical protein